LAHLLLLDIRLLAKTKVFAFKLILLPLALILILGSMFGGSDTQPVTIMAYESVAMMVMFSILTAFELAHSIVHDKLNHTLSRIRSTPTLTLQYALGKLLGITLALSVQMAVILTASRLIFGVVWPHIPAVILVTVAYGVAIGAIVLVCGLAAKDQAAISSFSAPILYGFSFLGGSFVDKYSFPGALRLIQQAIPNGKALNAYLSLLQGKGLQAIYPDLLMLVTTGAVFFGIALCLLNRRRGSDHARITSRHEAASADA
jgi:ABC-2 type transport system permease protein